MARFLAVVDDDSKTMFVERVDGIYEYDIAMYAAALHNPKYWETAEIGKVDRSIPELVIGYNHAT